MNILDITMLLLLWVLLGPLSALIMYPPEK